MQKSDYDQNVTYTVFCATVTACLSQNTEYNIFLHTSIIKIEKFRYFGGGR